MASVTWDKQEQIFTGDELKHISPSEQILIAQNASKKQYFMTATKCDDPTTAHQFLSEASYDADVAVINYVHSLTDSGTKPLPIDTTVPDMFRLTTADQMKMFDDMEDQKQSAAVTSPFVPHMPDTEAKALQINHQIDHRDSCGLYRKAKIVEKWGTNVKVQYHDNSTCWSDYVQQIHRFAAYESITKRTLRRFTDLRVGDYLDVNPVHAHKGWKFGEIVSFDTHHSAQTKVKYNCGNKEYEYWVHMDNEEEVALATSKTFAAVNTPQGNDDEQKEIDHDMKRNPLCIDLNEWNTRDIVQWISDLDGGKYSKYVNILLNTLDEQEISGADLKLMTERDLLDLGVMHFGDRKSLYKHLVILRKSMKERFKSNESLQRNVSVDHDEPDEFCCPISYEIMKDPVILSVSGQTYERKAIEGYIKSEHQDPITLQKAELKHIVPNRILKIVIQNWQRKWCM
eukprot:392305_1